MSQTCWPWTPASSVPVRGRLIPPVRYSVWRERDFGGVCGYRIENCWISVGEAWSHHGLGVHFVGALWLTEPVFPAYGGELWTETQLGIVAKGECKAFARQRCCSGRMGTARRVQGRGIICLIVFFFPALPIGPDGARRDEGEYLYGFRVNMWHNDGSSSRV